MRAARAFAWSMCGWAIVATSCGHAGVTVEYQAGYAWSHTERAAIERIAQQAAQSVRALLPELPSALRVTVQAGDKVIPETGETAGVGLPAAVYWTVNPAHPGGVLAVVDTQLRATLFHEFYHLVREARITTVSPLDRVIGEGLASAFEREFGEASTPWAAYSPGVAGWTDEFLALADDDREEWTAHGPDGRRWFGYKVGTYLADQAVKKSGQSLMQLATTPTRDILRWATPEAEASRRGDGSPRP
jgi:uncharacterized protein YjaZ